MGSSLLRIVLVLAVVGLLALEAGSIMFARLTVEDTAQRVADEAATVYDDTGSLESAREAAEAKLDELDDNAKIVRGGFVLRSDGRFNVTVKKRANTLVTDKIGFLEDLTIARATVISSEGRRPGV